jgi:hypothetical protein
VFSELVGDQHGGHVANRNSVIDSLLISMVAMWPCNRNSVTVDQVLNGYVCPSP